MKKLSMVLCVAAVATLVGCKDPDYVKGTSSQNEARSIGTKTEPVSCRCAPGTKHSEPCRCGAPDCRCIVEKKVEVKPVAPAPAVKPVAPPPQSASEYTTYIVQRGDYLSKISKRFNIRVAAIRKANPSIKKDVIFVGMKLKLPGKVDVGVQKIPAAKPLPAAKAFKGATKDYVVKSGDTLGAIAYGHGINIRQLKALNNLTSDNLRIGQKLKVPATKKAEKPAPAKTAPAAKSAEKKTEAKTEAPKAEAAKAEAVAPAAEDAAKADSESAPATPAAEASATDDEKAEAPATAAKASDKHETYVVQEGDDMTGVSIRWGVSAAAIRELNNLGEKDQLTPGQILKLPADAQQ